MNNKGWGLNTMIILCAVLIGALLISVVLISTNFFGLLKPDYSNDSQIDETRTYNSMELEMINASKKYVEYYYSNELENSDLLYIRVSSLQSDKYLNNLYDVKDAGIECSGYVKVEKQENIRYEPYMKCGSNYVTEGYISRFDG